MPYTICDRSGIKVEKMPLLLRAKQGLNCFILWGSAGGLCY